MPGSQRRALSAHRRRLKQRGIARLELRVRHDDVPLVRNVVAALSDPSREKEARALLRERFGAEPAKSFKAMLAEAPARGHRPYPADRVWPRRRIVSFLVDTNIVSEIRKGPRADRNVSAWYAAVPDASLYVSVLVLGELRRGVELKRSQDPEQAAALEKWLIAVQRDFGSRILAVDSSVAGEWGRMSAGRPVSVIDGLMAATAKVCGFTFVTRNTAHVMGLGVPVLNPFAEQA